jgi:predicted membrane protein
MRDENRDRSAHTSAALIPGLIVAGIGVVFLLHNLNIVRIYNVWRFWPLILIAIGFTKLVDSPHSNEKAGGSIMVLVGGVFLAANLGLFSRSVWQFWPVVLIGIGLMMLFNRTGRVAGIRIPPGKNFSKADAVAIFGGFKRQVATDDYRGANYVAVFGGGEIDLRRAQIRGDEAHVEVTAVFGGFEVRVPDNWIVANEVTGIFGGTADETRQPLPEAPGVKRHNVTGTAVFGGISIKN